MKTTAVLAAALLLLVSGISSVTLQTPFGVLVSDSVTNIPDKSYTTSGVYRGVLLGGLKRLQDSNTDFTFTTIENPDYGPFLHSVNGLAGNSEERTFWKLQVKTTNNAIITPDVGIGCYIPSANEQIILNYTMY